MCHAHARPFGLYCKRDADLKTRLYAASQQASLDADAATETRLAAQRVERDRHQESNTRFLASLSDDPDLTILSQRLK